MDISNQKTNNCGSFWWRCRLLALGIIMMASVALATENGGSVYPVGAETVLPGLTPGPGKTMLYEFSVFYTANQIDNLQGKSVSPEFKLRVQADAFKVVHNWNVHILGGMLDSVIGVPLVFQELHIPPGKYEKFSIGNVDVGVFQVAYHRKKLNWYYEGDVWLPGAAYSKNDILNIGQHNYAAGPVGGFTYLTPGWEFSSKLTYIINFNDVVTRYRSGNEFNWEYDAMRSVSHKLALGANGYWYKQTTNDLQNGLVVGDGNRGRDLTIGPEIRVHVGERGGFAVKFLHDTMVQNKPRGNAFWFQMALPIGLGK